MKLEEQVVSLELARQLKEAGYPQEGVFWWGGIGNAGLWCDHIKNDLPKQESRFTWYSAPTVSELMEKLPYERIVKIFDKSIKSMTNRKQKDSLSLVERLGKDTVFYFSHYERTHANLNT